MVLPYKPVSIIRTESYGNLSAPTICHQMNIQSQNDQDKLLEATKTYTKSLDNGILLVEPYRNRKVFDARNHLHHSLIHDGFAHIYYEPEEQVISQLNDECIVALVHQWFIDYDNEIWKQQIQQILNQTETCSTSFNLDRKLSFDKQYLTESLSNSTIYIAYYTISHLLQVQDSFNDEKLGIKFFSFFFVQINFVF
jgi:leucyl-tRNA synthetase